MRQTKILWDMPITIEILDPAAKAFDFQTIYDYFVYVDNVFSVFKPDSEISRINRGELKRDEWSADMQEIFALAGKTKAETNGYFDIYHAGQYNPLGLVKGWALQKAAEMLTKKGFRNFYLEAGGDIQVRGLKNGRPWQVGIRNPFNLPENIKVVSLSNLGIATSGTYLRGAHIYNPFDAAQKITEIVSLTVIAPDVCEADRFATAAFAMGEEGIKFLGNRSLAGYMINNKGVATYTSSFEAYVSPRN